MNFLAHLYLSGNDPAVMTGNFIGDFVKGKNLHERFGAAIAKGIDLHRSIDSFTDTHAVVAQSKKHLWSTYRHYAGVIVDIYYDHFLARNWNEYHLQLLPDYAEHCYGVLQTQRDALPEQVQFMLPHMVRGNWLANYATLEGIQRALSGMARRTRFVSKMEEAVNDLETHYTTFEQEFKLFFPQLKQHAELFLSEK
jgi:acyl carrier protein phosphodiesterase